MAYDSTKLVNLGGLELLAQKVASDYATNSTVSTIESKIEDIVAEGGEPNVIEDIQFVAGEGSLELANCFEVEIADKVATITTSDYNIVSYMESNFVSLAELSGNYASQSYVDTAIESAIAATGYASFAVADAVPTADTAQSNVLYLVMNSSTGYYDIYALVGEEVVLLDDVSIDLSDYAKSSDIINTEATTSTAGLMSADDKTNLDTLYSTYGAISVADDTEVSEMLESVFG